MSYSVIFSRFVSKARDSFVLWNNFPCVISSAQKLLWLRMKLLRSCVHHCSDVTSVGVQTGRIRWLFLLLNPMQTVLCSHCWAMCSVCKALCISCASQSICCSVWQQSVAVFNELWKQNFYTPWMALNGHICADYSLTGIQDPFTFILARIRCFISGSVCVTSFYLWFLLRDADMHSAY